MLFQFKSRRITAKKNSSSTTQAHPKALAWIPYGGRSLFGSTHRIPRYYTFILASYKKQADHSWLNRRTKNQEFGTSCRLYFIEEDTKHHLFFSKGKGEPYEAQKETY